jgi:hypothetical protein
MGRHEQKTRECKGEIVLWSRPGLPGRRDGVNLGGGRPECDRRNFGPSYRESKHDLADKRTSTAVRLPLAREKSLDPAGSFAARRRSMGCIVEVGSFAEPQQGTNLKRLSFDRTSAKLYQGYGADSSYRFSSFCSSTHKTMYASSQSCRWTVKSLSHKLDVSQ